MTWSTAHAGAPARSRRGNVSKKFGSVTALQRREPSGEQGRGARTDRGQRRGQVHAGQDPQRIPPAHPGELLLDGVPTKLTRVADARAHGIETVFQDLALINTLPVYMNLHLNKEPRFGPFLRRSLMQRNSRRYLDDIGIRIASVNDDVANLSGGQRQAIAVARSVYSNSQILLLDEPLAAMGAKEGAIILDLITMLRERGEVSIVLIAHNYTQVLDVCDRVNLLQHGEITLDKKTTETSAEELLDLVANEYRRGGRLAGNRGQLLDEVRRR